MYPMNNRETAIENLKASAAGLMETHVWTSPKYDDAPMKYAYTAVGTHVDPESHGLPKEFAQDVELVYAGVLTHDQARQRVKELRYGSLEDQVPSFDPTPQETRSIALRALEGMLGRMMHP